MINDHRASCITQRQYEHAQHIPHPNIDPIGFVAHTLFINVATYVISLWTHPQRLVLSFVSVQHVHQPDASSEN